ncbi:MAG: DUF1501 domain-containing protein [Isosphaeraceae bacterium]
MEQDSPGKKGVGQSAVGQSPRHGVEGDGLEAGPTTVAHRHSIGVVRREVLQVGFSGFFGLGLSTLLSRQLQAGRSNFTSSPGRRAKSVILVFLTGAPSHIDTFDMKPDAPEAIRGEFKPIGTKVPGLSICEHLPRLASWTDRLAIVRSMSHTNLNHLNATHWVLTGHPQPGAFFDKIASRDDHPCYASALNYLRPSGEGIPTGVSLPTNLIEGPLIWPGQHAGFLGPRHDPWHIKQDPSKPGFRVEDLALPQGFTVDRLRQRLDLLGQLEAGHEAIESAGGRDPLAAQRKQALSLLLSGKVARAFDLDKEDPKVRDRYGRHLFGQSLLLARRLVEAGVPIVQANMGRVQNWDTHSANFKSLKSRLLPPLDQGVSSLLDDLARTGLLDETLVVITGEFGRTPRVGAGTGNVNTADGRDHWAHAFTTVFAGAGIKGGQTIGQSDRIGAYPSHSPFTPADLAATIYRALGLDPSTEIQDRLGRPTRLCTGQEIAALYSGATV